MTIELLFKSNNVSAIATKADQYINQATARLETTDIQSIRLAPSATTTKPIMMQDKVRKSVTKFANINEQIGHLIS